MDKTIMNLLDQEIQTTLAEVKKAKTNSDEAKAALYKLTQLCALREKELGAEEKERRLDNEINSRIDNRKIRDAELDAKADQLHLELLEKEKELELKKAELAEAKRGRRWRTALDIAGISAPLAISSYWMFKGLKFEEEGKIYSSRTTQFMSGIMRLFGKKG